MILEFLIIVLFLAIFVLLNQNDQVQEVSASALPAPEERQQVCGTARVVKDKALQLIHTGCSIDRKATFHEAVPGASPFGDDGFKWDQENALLGGGYTLGNL